MLSPSRLLSPPNPLRWASAGATRAPGRGSTGGFGSAQLLSQHQSLLEQLQHALGHLVGLGQHGLGGLDQDVVLGVGHHLVGNVGVADGGLSVLDVLLHDGEIVDGVVQTVLGGAQSAADVGDIVDGVLDHVQGGIGVHLIADVQILDPNGGGVAVLNRHGELVIAVTGVADLQGQGIAGEAELVLGEHDISGRDISIGYFGVVHLGLHSGDAADLRGDVLGVSIIRGIGACQGDDRDIVTQSIDLVIKLEEWDREREYDRLGLEEQYEEILGNKVVCHSIPIRPGRNLAIIVETAAINHRQKQMGYNAAHELYRRVTGNLQKKREED